MNCNEASKINMCIFNYNSHSITPQNVSYARINYLDNNKYLFHKYIENYGDNNDIIKDLYKNFDINKHKNIIDNKIYNHIYSKIINHDIVNILLQNFCKYHYIKHIDIKLQKYHIKDKYDENNYILILDTITFIIDETKEPKESNNRKITFYKNFYDFYKIRDSNKNYKILKEDEFVLIEELDTIQDITKPIENKKTSDDIIREKDAEIEKLKREIQELKKFYINS